MKRPGVATVVCGLFLAAFGTGCCSSHPLCDSYGDVIDWIGEQEPELDHLYHPTLDINRAGQPEWCRSRVNRALYRVFCGHDCPRCLPCRPPVYHYPGYHLPPASLMPVESPPVLVPPAPAEIEG